VRRVEMLERIKPGMVVLASDGGYLGEVVRVTLAGEGTAATCASIGWLETVRSTLAGGRFFVPLDAILQVRGSRIYLTETEHGAHARGWDRPPANYPA
jgi:hypothetical protein